MAKWLAVANVRRNGCAGVAAVTMSAMAGCSAEICRRPVAESLAASVGFVMKANRNGKK
jgi:hypothetical protein